METILIIVILLTGFYLAWNIGANDVANAMGTSVGSGALTLRQAVIVAALLEFAGAFFFGSHVSKTMQSGLINSDLFFSDPKILVYGMLAALASAGIWLQVASYCGWPVSTTHSIVGAIVGVGFAVGGMHAVYWKNVGYIITTWIFSPIMGGVIAYYIFTFIRKKVLYTLHPFESARKVTPLLVFCLIFVLSSILIFEGFRNVALPLSYAEKSGLVILVSALAALISHFLMKKMGVSKPAPLDVEFSPEVVESLQKVQKYLNRVKGKTSGNLQYKVGLITQEVDHLSASLHYQREKISHTHGEYFKVEQIFGYLQIISACMMAFAHGANDVANAIGPLSAAIAILKTGMVAIDAPIPLWALALGGVGIVIGLASWGWRVMETIGKKITELTPSRGFAAEFGAATTIVLASRVGMPVSTTHTLVGAVLGVGLARGLGAVNINTTRDILISWLVTVPVGAILAILLFYPIHFIFG